MVSSYIWQGKIQDGVAVWELDTDLEDPDSVLLSAMKLPERPWASHSLPASLTPQDCCEKGDYVHH